MVCDEISDPHNLGAIIRTAECAGAHGVVIPKRRSAGLTAVVAKTSAGAVAHVPVARVPNIPSLLKELKKQGVWVFGTAADGNTTLYDADLKGPAAIVIGSEGEGMTRLAAENCDFLVSIPMRGQSEFPQCLRCGGDSALRGSAPADWPENATATRHERVRSDESEKRKNSTGPPLPGTTRRSCCGTWTAAQIPTPWRRSWRSTAHGGVEDLTLPEEQEAKAATEPAQEPVRAQKAAPAPKPAPEPRRETKASEPELAPQESPEEPEEVEDSQEEEQVPDLEVILPEEALPRPPRPISVEEVVGRTVESRDGRAREPLKEYKQRRRFLFSRRPMMDTEEFYDSAAPEPEPEPEPLEPEPPLTEVADSYRELRGRLGRPLPLGCTGDAGDGPD